MDVAESEDRARRPELRVLGVAGVLLAEYLAISFAFDAYSAVRRGGSWSILGHLGAAGPLFVVLGAALLLLARGWWQSMPLPQVRPLDSRALTVHAALAIALGIVARFTFGGIEPPPGPAVVWFLAFVAIAGASAAALFHGGVGDWRWLGRVLLKSAPLGAVLALAAWLAGLASVHLWAHLSTATFLAVSALLRAWGFELEVDYAERTIELDGFIVSVAPVCSGAEGIGLYAALMTGFLAHQRKTLRFPRALFLLPLGIVVIWLANVGRIASLMLLGARVNAEIALGSFHSKAGWALFCAVTLGVAAIAHASPWFSRRAAAPASGTPATAWLAPLMVFLALGLVTSAFASERDALYGVGVAGALAALWYFRDHYRPLDARVSATGLVVGAAVGVVWLVLPSEGRATPVSEGWPPWLFGLWIVTRGVGSVLVVPVIEELAFRGFLARWMTGKDFLAVSYRQLSAFAVLGSSLAFGLLHERWLLATATGAVYALLARRRGHLADAVVAHMASNAVIAVWVLATGYFEHW